MVNGLLRSIITLARPLHHPLSRGPPESLVRRTFPVSLLSTEALRRHLYLNRIVALRHIQVHLTSSMRPQRILDLLREADNPKRALTAAVRIAAQTVRLVCHSSLRRATQWLATVGACPGKVVSLAVPSKSL